MKFEIGDRVKFTNKKSSYSIGSANPLVGTRYECEGSVLSANSMCVSVAWDNGLRNGYKDGDLSLSEDINVISIWE